MGKSVYKIAVVVLALFTVSSVFAIWYRLFYHNNQYIYNNAVHFYSNWENKKAEREIKPILKNNPENFTAELLYGNILFRLGKLNQAKKVFISIATKDSAKKTEALQKLAHTLFFLNDLDSAQAVLNEISTIAIRNEDSLAIARTYYLTGLIAFNSLKYQKAMNLQRKSLAMALKLKNRQQEADALRQIGVLYWYSSGHDSAYNYYYKPALKIYREINDKIGEATTLSNIGLLYKDQEHVKKSIEYQLRAFLLQKQIGDQIGLANSYYFLSNIISIAGWHSSIAYTFLQRSYEISNKIGYQWGMEVAERALRTYFFANPDLSFQRITSSDSLSSHVGEGIIYVLWDKILAQKKQRDFNNEIKNLYRYIKLCDSLDYRNGEQVALGYLAWSLSNTGRYSEAESALEKAKKITSDIHLATDFLLDTTRVELDIQKGKIKKATRTLRHLADSYDSLYLNSITSVNKRVIENNISSIHQKRNSVYSMLIDILYSQHDQRLYKYVQKERAIPFWWRTNAHYKDIDGNNHYAIGQFVKSLENSNAITQYSDYLQSLISYYSDREDEIHKMNSTMSDYISDKNNRLVVPTEILRKQLRKDEVLAEYFVGKNRLLIFVTRNDTSTVIESDIRESQLYSLVTLYNGAIERGANNPDDDIWKGISHHLYNLVIAPIVEKGLLRENDHLIISSHKILHLLSFQTLDVEPSMRPTSFCVEHYRISYIPSTFFFTQMRKKGKLTYHSLATIAPDIKSLPWIETEIQNIPKNSFSRFVSLKNDQAKKDSVLNAFKNFDIVHIASHAIVNQWFPMFSTVECSDQNLKLYEILQESVNAKLVILSACDTGLSISSTGGLPDDEDIISFSRAFLAKGTSAVIATYWMVNDSSTAQFMNLVYKHIFPATHNQPDHHIPALKTHPSVAILFNNAQRQWIADRRKAGMSDHPFFWGAFFITGGTF